MKRVIKCSEGHEITAGDSISFSYGIPPVHVVAPVYNINGTLTAITPDHTPKSCALRTLKKHVGSFTKVIK